MVHFSVGTSASCNQRVFSTFQKKSLITVQTYCISEADFPWNSLIGQETSVRIGHFGVASGTGSSFKFKLIDTLTPSYKKSC